MKAHKVRHGVPGSCPPPQALGAYMGPASSLQLSWEAFTPSSAVPIGASMAEGSGKITSALDLEAEISCSEAEWWL